MKEKLKEYLDGLFSAVPDTDEVRDMKEELYTGLAERYDDLLGEGLDEQEAYDRVIDGVGDMRELFDELGNQGGPAPAAGEAEAGESSAEGTQAQADELPPESGTSTAGRLADDLQDLVQKVVDATAGFIKGLVSDEGGGEPYLANEIKLTLAEVGRIGLSYVSESITLMPGEGDELVLREYINSSDPSLFATVELSNGAVNIRHGRRQGVFGLRSRVELLLPSSWGGNLALSTVGGSIMGKGVWHLSSLQAKTVSGEVNFEEVEALSVSMGSTSGTVTLGRCVGYMTLHSISGSIRVERAIGGGSFKTTSGSVRVYFDQLSANVDASSVSGGVRLGLPGDASFEFDGRAVSGAIHTAFDDKLAFQRRNKAHGFVGAAPYYTVKASTTSGGIHVND